MEEAVDLVVLYKVEELPKGVEQQIEVLAAGRRADRRGDAEPADDEATSPSTGSRSTGWRTRPTRSTASCSPTSSTASTTRSRCSSSSRSWTCSRRRPTRSSTWRTRSRPSRSRSPDAIVDTFALVVTIAVALGFTYTNGFHDSANAIATSVSTRALTPAGGAGDGRGDEPGRRLPRQRGRQDRQRGHDRHARRRARAWCILFAGAGRRDRLEPDHLVLRPAVVLLARAVRRAGRRGARRRHGRALGRRARQGRHPDVRSRRSSAWSSATW